MKKIVAILVAGLFSAGVFAQASKTTKEEPKKAPTQTAPAEKPKNK